MGKSQGDQTVTTKTTLPEWYTGPAKVMFDQAQAAAANIAKPYMGNTVAGLDPITKQAVGAMGANMGSTNAGYAAAQQGAANAMNYRPSMISAGQQGYNYNPANINGGSFLQGNIGAYMNPYIQNVEQNALANQNLAFKNNLNTIGDQAIGARAFGGSRQGVAEGVAASENARQMGDLSAQLRNQGYGQAAGMMEQDFARSMQAQMANQQAGMSNAQFGANLGLSNIQNAMQAAQANQNAGLQGAQFNLQGANELGALTGQGQQAYLQGIQQALAAGQINQDYAQQLINQDITRYDAMSAIPANQLNMLLAALSGAQVPTSTTQKTPTSGNWLTGAAGGAMAGIPFGFPGMIAGGLLGGIAGS